MDKKNVLVLFGGCSPEHEISVASADTVLRKLPEKKFNVIPVYIARDGRWLLYDGVIDKVANVDWEKFGIPAVLSPDRVNRGLLRMVGAKVRTLPVDVVFPVLHGANGEDGTIQGLCALAGVPCVGCGVLASALAMDKHFTKIVAKSAGLQQAKYLTIHHYEDIPKAAAKVGTKLGYPCFVKPATAGSSVGVTKVKERKELLPAIEAALHFSDKVVIEKAVVGREVECGLLGYGADVRASVICEIVPAADFYDYDAKYNNADSQAVVPADIPAEIAQKIQAQAVTVFRAIGGKGLSRADFFIEEGTNNVIFNEINTLPGFTEISAYFKMWEASGVSIADVLEALVVIALMATTAA